MSIYTVSQKTCPVTGIVDVQLCMGKKYFKGSFLEPVNANKFIRRKQLRFIQDAIASFVKHKKILHQVGSGFYKRQSKLNALDKCIQLSGQYTSSSLEGVCRSFLKHYKTFEKILPCPNNASYQAQKDRLDDMRQFCRKILKTNLS